MPSWFGRSPGHAPYSSRRVLPVARARTRSPRPKLRALGSPPADLLVAALGGRPRRGVFCRHRAIDDKWQAPLADALVADDDPTRRQDQLNISQAQAEAVIEPDRMLYDRGREAEAAIRVR